MRKMSRKVANIEKTIDSEDDERHRCVRDHPGLVQAIHPHGDKSRHQQGSLTLI